MEIKIKKPFVMDYKERHCFDVIRHALENELYVWPKVKIKDLFELADQANTKNISQEYLALSEKHVDFVLCDNDTFVPLLVLRFKAMPTHEDEVLHTEEQQLLELLNAAGLPLLEESLTELDSYKTSLEYASLRDRIMQTIGRE